MVAGSIPAAPTTESATRQPHSRSKRRRCTHGALGERQRHLRERPTNALPINFRVPLDQFKAQPAAEHLKFPQRPASLQEAGDGLVAETVDSEPPSPARSLPHAGPRGAGFRQPSDYCLEVDIETRRSPAPWIERGRADPAHRRIPSLAAQVERSRGALAARSCRILRTLGGFFRGLTLPAPTSALRQLVASQVDPYARELRGIITRWRRILRSRLEA